MISNRTIIIIIVGIFLASAGWWLMRTKTSPNTPQPISWPQPEKSAANQALNDNNQPLTISNDTSFVLLDYSATSNIFLTYLPEKNELWQITTKGEKSLLTTYTNLTVMSASIRPDGKTALIRALLDSGNQQLISMDLASKATTILPYTVLQAFWLSDNRLAYLYDDGRNRTISTALNPELKNWAPIKELTVDYRGSQLSVDPNDRYAIVTSPHSSNTAGQSQLVDLTTGATTKIADDTTGCQWVANASLALLQQIASDGKPALLILDPAKSQPSKIDNTTAPIISFIVDNNLIGIKSGSSDPKTITALTVKLDSGKSTTGTLTVDLENRASAYLVDRKNNRLIISDGKKVLFINFSDLKKQLISTDG